MDVTEPSAPEPSPAEAVASRGARPVRGTRRRARRSWTGESGPALLVGAVGLLAAVLVALLVGWVALLVVVALLQVLLARGWVDHLEIPGAVAAACAVLVVALIADAGVVVVRVSTESGERAHDLVQLAPALAALFPVAVLAQLLRRGPDARDGALAGLVAVVSGGALAVGLALLLPLEASAAGAAWVIGVVGVCAVACGAAGVLLWLRGQERGSAVALPALVAVLAGPAYVAARIVAG